MLSEKHCKNCASRADFADMYRKFKNDYLTVECFAAGYMVSEKHASRIIRIGRKAHNLGY